MALACGLLATRDLWAESEVRQRRMKTTLRKIVNLAVLDNALARATAYLELVTVEVFEKYGIVARALVVVGSVHIAGTDAT